MNVGAVLIELKPGSAQRVDDWARYLHEHRTEALATLAHEGVTIER